MFASSLLDRALYSSYFVNHLQCIVIMTSDMVLLSWRGYFQPKESAHNEEFGILREVRRKFVSALRYSSPQEWQILLLSTNKTKRHLFSFIVVLGLLALQGRLCSAYNSFAETRYLISLHNNSCIEVYCCRWSIHCLKVVRVRLV